MDKQAMIYSYNRKLEIKNKLISGTQNSVDKLYKHYSPK